MGTVYLAHHEALDQKVAVKVLSPDASCETARFMREARAAASLQSEHVVRVSDVGQAEGVGPYMVMEYLVGADLEQVIEAKGPLPVAEAVDALLEAIDALAEAHAKGIRALLFLKPSYLLLLGATRRRDVVREDPGLRHLQGDPVRRRRGEAGRIRAH